MAWLFSTLDILIVFGTTGGGFGAGGGGTSGKSTTGVLPVPPLEPLLPVNTGVGGSAFRLEMMESGRAGGTSDALTPGSSGTLLGFETLSISTVRSERVGCVSDVDVGRIVFRITSGAASGGGSGTKVRSSISVCWTSKRASYA